MTKRKSQVVGNIKCPLCELVADVCTTGDKNYKFIYCQEHKTINCKSQSYQDYINSNMKLDIEGEAVEVLPGRKEDKPEFEPVIVESSENEKPENEKTLDSDKAFWPWEDD